jgi:sterol desaturase/sphingolipid hydroxylase (fatty acid hydroxylase superfamily)
MSLNTIARGSRNRMIQAISAVAFKIEHGKAAYWADFVVYGAAIVALLIFLIMSVQRAGIVQVLFFALLGLIVWTFLEYAIHRFVLHAIEPFKRLHAMHHLQPRALICAPTVLTATLIALLIFAPTFLLSQAVVATSVTLGLLIGYLAYSLTHHAIHHWPAKSNWMKTRKVNHAVHHHQKSPTYFGVTSSFWDRIFFTHCVSAEVMQLRQKQKDRSC